MKTDETVVITADSIRIDTFHAGEHSGFVHTNRTAVRITHIPTGVTVESRDEPTAWRNRQKCLDMLPAAIAQHSSAGCACPSGDGSLRHPCPVHPASGEQAGANVGHGHVFPRADGVKARCGGPGLCSECSADASRARATLAQPSPAPELPERGTQHRFSISEQSCRHDFSGVWWNDKGITKTGRECRHCGFFVADATEAPELERSEVLDFNPYRHHAEKIRQRVEEAASVYEAGRSALGYMEDIAESAVIVRNGLAELSAQHDRIVGALRAELETERMRLAGCGVAALGYFEGCAEAYKSASLSDVLKLREERDAAQARVAELEALIDSPELHDFAKGVTLEAAHQRKRWGTSHDAGKQPSDWFWLVGYLAGKALHACATGNTEKALHHCISTAAALNNWHASILGADTSMRPGLPAEELPAGEGGDA